MVDSVGRLGKRVRLLVLDHLQPMFERSQEAISLGHVAVGGLRNVAACAERLECANGRRIPQSWVTPAQDELLCLREELDLANASAAELDVVARNRDPRMPGLGMNLALDGMDVLDRGKLQMLAQDESFHILQKL